MLNFWVLIPSTKRNRMELWWGCVNIHNAWRDVAYTRNYLGTSRGRECVWSDMARVRAMVVFDASWTQWSVCVLAIDESSKKVNRKDDVSQKHTCSNGERIEVRTSVLITQEERERDVTLRHSDVMRCLTRMTTYNNLETLQCISIIKYDIERRVCDCMSSLWNLIATNEWMSINRAFPCIHCIRRCGGRRGVQRPPETRKRQIKPYDVSYDIIDH